ncbi:MAG: transcriptional regulator [Oscillospiraceae bacterium]|nr:transcriptional regulator [Oscillospiraceae bacterium]
MDPEAHPEPQKSAPAQAGEREVDTVLEAHQLSVLKQVAAALAAQFGSNCEVVVHDLESQDPAHSIVHIENGHVTGRKVGDGPSNVVLEQIMSHNEDPQDCLGYLCRTDGGKVLKSSTVYVRSPGGAVSGILSINFDISALLMVEQAVSGITSTPCGRREENIAVVNVNDMLDGLIEQSVALVGKPAALMNKDDKVRAIQFLSQHGAFLVTKSGDKVAKYFGISKYTLYSYIDLKQEEKRHEQD